MGRSVASSARNLWLDSLVMNRMNYHASSCLSEVALIIMFHPPRPLTVWVWLPPTGSAATLTYSDSMVDSSGLPARAYM